jgi:pilus assembly protein TadC
VFLCGGALGAVVMSYWGHTALHGARPAADGMYMSTREWQQELNLTDEQTRLLTSILDDYSRYYNNLTADGNSRIMQILNEEQKRKYQLMIAAHKKK